MIQRGERLKLEKILERFSEIKILVVGDVMMDRFIWGKVSRISPEAPVPVVLVEKETFLLGGAANVVNNICSLGGKAWLCGVVGEDEMGQKIINRLTEIGVDAKGVFLEMERQTTVKTRVIAEHQQLARIDREATHPPKNLTLRYLAEFLRKNFDGFDGIIVSDYGKGLLTKTLIRTILQRGKEAKKFVLVDPKLKNFFVYKGATAVTPNIAEASVASRVLIHDLPSLKKAGRMLLKQLKCNALVITRGEEGMAIFEPNREPFLVPTIAQEVYDVTGAGDTVIGTMGCALGAGASMIDAARLANYAAGIVVGKVGTATVSQEELREVIKERH